ncbi:PDZ domain-containing protein [Clostridium brassicae]|uniref:PDZ domain-containing protein n=1 Tax=Clostridium brassicae TaxID=2999072 RepID=A0ABT4D5I4_9CLOT|nr:PDZ domain-containing protein [Clostridium brassicae]MCY6957549.1 PDZ domain-containing protein [Clostridium brassicae]
MNIMLNTLKVVAYALVKPPYVFILLAFFIMFYKQNKKIILMQKMIIGDKLNTTFELTISQIVLGILGGIVGSILLSYLGVAFNENTSIELIFLLSIIFMFINPRLICFSYSGAFLGFVSILLEIMREMYGIEVKAINFLNLDIVALMTLIAILHFVEGILVMIDGSKGSIPIFTKKDNKIIGGFAFKRYWAIPIGIVLIVNSQMHGLSEIIQLNKWDALIDFSSPLNVIKNAAIMLMPFYGVLGYTSITFTKSKKQKSTLSGIMIMLYSVTLYIFARLATLNIFFRLFVVIYAPMAHEFMIYIQKYMEVKEEPKYVSDERGIMVLEVAPNSQAYKMGIKSGDVFVEINNKKIVNEDDIFKTIKETSSSVWFKIKKTAGNLEEIRYRREVDLKKLGIVFVPISVPENSMVVKMNENKFSDVLQKIKDERKK